MPHLLQIERSGFGLMKKIIGLLIVLPALCLALGYGAGMFLGKSQNAEVPDKMHVVSKDSHGNDLVMEEKKPIVVKLGQMIVPVYKASSVTYVVTNLGVTVQDLKGAEYYNMGENAVRLRDAIFVALKHSAEGRDLRGVTIDTEKLARNIAKDIKPKFVEVDNVIFLDFYKKDVARS